MAMKDNYLDKKPGLKKSITLRSDDKGIVTLEIEIPREHDGNVAV